MKLLKVSISVRAGGPVAERTDDIEVIQETSCCYHYLSDGKKKSIGKASLGDISSKVLNNLGFFAYYTYCLPYQEDEAKESLRLKVIGRFQEIRELYERMEKSLKDEYGDIL